jgi:phosphatidylglycerol:prolipoprotein diacylglycerol transferase
MVHEPLILSIGSIAVSGYGIALAAAVTLAYMVGRHDLRSRGENPDGADDLFLVAVCGVLGAKVYEVVVSGASLTGRGGFSYLGGCLTAFPALWAIASLRRYSPWRMCDTLALAAAAAVPVARTGCWAIGDDYGLPWASRFAVAFPHGAPPSTVGTFRDTFGVMLPGARDDVVTVHPTQLYEVILGIGILLVLLHYREHRHPAGWLGGVFLVLTGVERFAIEFLRAKTDRVLPFGFTIAQSVALLLVALGVWLMRIRSAKQVEATHPDEPRKLRPA